eukprot:TRINITY_DN46688_c0_g1_i1.p1 TRINITY_DN46688_c0_g1~~TRINITY_DN46688_c0_g1_i1.p1  ORF type:complete len:457 (-),score=90.73 TRINITY_DN46688_c0_g1_i1:157-1527(-)
MPNPGTMTSFQSFEREHINMVVQVPDYKLRKQLALEHGEDVVVEAFSAFDEVFHLHLRWNIPGNSPELWLSVSLLGGSSFKFVLDLIAQSPQFTYVSLRDTGPSQSQVSWSAASMGVEVRRSPAMIQLRLDNEPTNQNDSNMSLEQTVVFSITGMAWKLDETVLQSLHCKSYRSRVRDTTASQKDESRSVDVQPHQLERIMAGNLAAMLGAADTRPDIEIQLDNETPAPAEEGRCEDEKKTVSLPSNEDRSDANIAVPQCKEDEGAISKTSALAEEGRGGAPTTIVRVHSFVLQSHSAVFRRMLAGPMCEATCKTIKMADVTPTELDDFVRALYSLRVTDDVRDDEERLLGLLALADRYQVVALRDEASRLLEPRLSDVNMATFLKVADMHQAAGLRTAALLYITQRTSRIVAAMDSNDPTIRNTIREHVLTVTGANAATAKERGEVCVEPQDTRS